ncbi:MAG: DUF763 domain-containing protein [Candidatus Omnitrophica bacterium]|nr:DUF763 domain-containing protein [Candidatus Omnitrophota bacterium]
MIKRNIAELPLHFGNVPEYLFEKQKKILFEIGRLIIMEFGTEEFLARLSDPVYFQALGCISGFDWHSSGVTTTVCHALKESFSKNPEYGLFCFGGKGKNGLKTPQEIENCKFIEKKEKFILISKLTAKVDNNCIQDGYNLYHHMLFVDKKGNWVVIQQGMNILKGYARRYHWFNKTTNSENNRFIIEPHTGIISSRKEKNILNLVDKNCEIIQKNIIDYLTSLNPENVIKELKIFLEKSENIFEVEKKIILPKHHDVRIDFNMNGLYKVLCKLKEKKIESFEDIVLTEGIGMKSLRALFLISELIYGKKVLTSDPARYSFAFGGKDGHPYPIDVKTFDETIEFLKYIIDKAKIGDKEKIEIFRKLSQV